MVSSTQLSCLTGSFFESSRHISLSLCCFTVCSWEAIILVADSQPFKDLHNILSDIGDDRTWVFAEWIGQSFAPKANGEWLPNYHSMLYNLTDDAMTVCPPDTKWVVVTNGDNEYARGFMERVLKESRDTSAFERPVVSTEAPIDIVAFDFYSRYLRPTAPPCERFGVRQSNFSPCKPNLLRWCQVDLGAVALSWHRWQREGRSFGAIDGSDRGLGAEHNDGLAMEELMKDGWKSRRVQDACLFVHAPSPQSCAWHGGVWDDRDIIETGGGTCISVEEAANILNHEGQDVEEVRISIANDRHIDAFEGATQELLIPGRCLRRKEYASPHVWGRNMVWFSELCTDPEDMDTFAKQMKLFYPTDEDLEAALLPQSPSVPQPT